MLKEFLTSQLFGDGGLMTAGVPVVVRGRPVMLFAKLTNLLTDGEGLQKSLQWKGASSLKPCFRHWNVLMRGSDLASRAAGQFVEMSCPDPAQFKRSTNESVGEVVDMLLAGRARVSAGLMFKTVFEEIEQASGFAVTSEGLLADANLRPHVLQAATFDWMHTALSDGTLSLEAFLIVATCEKKIGVGMVQLDQYFRLDWQFPKALQQKSRYLYSVWNANRKSEHKLKCSCSELLGLYKLLLHFVETRIVGNPAVALEVESFRACCKVVDIILRAKRRTDPRGVASELEAAISSHMRKHVAVYTDIHLKPKHHWMFDVAEQFRRDPFVLDMFVVERLHLDIKRVAENVKNTRTFDFLFFLTPTKTKFKKQIPPTNHNNKQSPGTSNVQCLRARSLCRRRCWNLKRSWSFAPSCWELLFHFSTSRALSYPALFSRAAWSSTLAMWCRVTASWVSRPLSSTQRASSWPLFENLLWSAAYRMTALVGALLARRSSGF
jgi:hypothetical protein